MGEAEAPAADPAEAPAVCGTMFSASTSHPALTAKRIRCDLPDRPHSIHEGPDGDGGRLAWRQTPGEGSDPTEWLVDGDLG